MRAPTGIAEGIGGRRDLPLSGFWGQPKIIRVGALTPPKSLNLRVVKVIHQIVDCVRGSLPVPFFAQQQEGVQVDPGQTNVILQHFLMLRFRPIRRGAVAKKAAFVLVP